MAYQLKTTGIAANCTMMIAVDPDTGTIKDFASSGVTTDLLVGANVTISSQTWDGVTRHYFRNGAGTADADFVKFGATKPNWSNNVNGTTRTAVFIGEAAGAYVRVFGNDASSYFSGQSGVAGGNTLPYVVGCGWSSNVDGGGTALTSGQKALFGYSSVHGTSATAYWALHDAAAMSSSSETAPASTSVATNFDLTYVGRRADSTGNNRDKIHAILIFNVALSESQWDTLRDDWFGTLLESAGGGTITGASSITLGDVTNTATGTVTSGITGASSITLGAVITVAAGTVSGAGAITGASSITLGSVGSSAGGVLGATLTVGPFKNKSGTVLASQSIAHVVVLNASSRATVVSLASQTTNGSGMLAINNGSLVPGTGYMVASWNSDGSAAGNAKVTAAA